jgi:hypothetical protein
VEGGLTLESWMELYVGCHNYTASGPRLLAWPDGRSMLRQPALVVRMFNIISEMTYNEMRQASGK